MLSPCTPGPKSSNSGRTEFLRVLCGTAMLPASGQRNNRSPEYRGFGPGENKEFESSVGGVYCWTKLSANTIPATIKHMWYLDDKDVFKYPLQLKVASTRTWSSRSVRSGNRGVDVTDESGTVLSSTSFKVK